MLVFSDDLYDLLQEWKTQYHYTLYYFISTFK